MLRYSKLSALMLALAMAGAVHATQSLQVTLSEPANKTDQQTGKVIITMTNTGNEPVDILKFKTPFVEAGGGLPGPLFSVKDGLGKDVAYTGSFAKFVNITADSFIHLLPGQSIHKAVDLSKDYNLSNGSYSIDYDQDLSAVRPEAGQKLMPAPVPKNPKHSESNVLQVWVNGSLLEAKKRPSVSMILASPEATTGCNSTQSGPVATAISTAYNNASDINNIYMQDHWSVPYTNSAGNEDENFEPSARFTYWLGTSSSNEGYDEMEQEWYSNTVTPDNMFLLEADQEQQRTMTSNLNVVCDPCTGWSPNTAAHTTTTSPATVYLCPAFFKLGTTGADTQWGTLLHEVSHIPAVIYNVNGAGDLVETDLKGTLDYAYGQKAAAALATSNESQARFNADSWEYFYENPTNLQ